MDTKLGKMNNMELLVSDMENEVKQTARKLMRMTPGGNRLSADQAADLAVYSLMTSLNPFNGECYYLPGAGPTPGVAGYRVKTQEWLIATNTTGTPVRVWEEYREAMTDEAEFDPEAGDIAWVCTLYDSVSKEAWEQSLIKTATAYSQMGASFKEARQTALEDIGPCPSWSAVGVVYGQEKFARDGKPEKWDRNERAKKRAAKGCYRKGFPHVRIPDPEYGDVIEGITEDVKTEIVGELEGPKTKRIVSEHGNLSDLGFQTENPDPVKDKTLERWESLTARADVVKVPYGEVVREKVTNADLIAACDELERFVVDAEAQEMAD